MFSMFKDRVRVLTQNTFCFVTKYYYNQLNGLEHKILPVKSGLSQASRKHRLPQGDLRTTEIEMLMSKL